MRILAIRGENLASLEAIDVNFERDPLGRAGLFAICGPTGAGKTTILDALCVALFDRTPRLGGRSNVLVGHLEQPREDRLAATDVRGLLRRGSPAGFAEVDFIGRDTRRYRARWDVWRARRRPYGRLQPQAVSLEDLASGKNLGGTKSETLAAIESRLGLSFEQFRRSALLAQGEFAAFLRAGERDRGELLERMTGTEIYGALSRAAYQRNKKEQDQLAALVADVDRHAVLDDAARDELESARNRARASLTTLEAELDCAERAAAWHRRHEELIGGQKAARDELCRVESMWQDAEPVRRELDQVVHARGHGPVIEASDRARAVLARRREHFAEARRESDAHTVQRDAARERLRAVQRDLTAARAEYQRAKPELRRARHLEAEILAAERVVEEVKREWELAAQAAERARAERERAESEMAGHERAAACAAAWLADNADIEPLAAQWPRWQSALEEYQHAARRIGQLAALRPRLASRKQRAQDALERSSDQHRACKDALDGARARLDTAQRAADRMPLDAAREARDTMASRLDALRRLAEVKRAAQAALASRDRHCEQARQARVRAREAIFQDENLAGEASRSEAALNEAGRVFDRLRLARDLDEHRAELARGEPCPLCGATEHPWAKAGSAVAQLVDEQRQRVAALRAEIEQLERERASARATARESRRRAEDHDADQAACSRDLSSARERWRDELTSLGELVLVSEPTGQDAAEWLSTRLDAASQKLEHLREDEKQAARMADSARQAHGKVAARDSDLFQARAQLGDCKAELDRASTALGDCDAEIASARLDLERLTGVLGRAFSSPAPGGPARADRADWRARLESDPGRFRAECADRVAAWTRCQNRLADSREACRAAAIKLDAGGQRALATAQRERELADTQKRRTAECDLLRGALGELFAGRSSAAVNDQLTRAIEKLDRDVHAAGQIDQSRAEKAASSAATMSALGDMVEQASAECERAEAALAAAVTESGMDADTLRRRAATEDRWIADRKDDIAALGRAREQARAVADERARTLREHRDSGPPALDRASAETAISRARRAREEAYSALSELTSMMRRDDEARARRAEMATQVTDRERRARLYSTLAELIGSADGKKFRVFAQSLTLDALLASANHHLEDLASRYRLIRVPGNDLELQVVDRDMGDEVRSINSLSGGESFLLSLALALGLSSLAARDTRVDSLLIDEGFGSLDPAALDIALSVLDALQASGRKVGLISHVPGLAERVGVRITVRPQGGGRSLIRVTER
ncbi:MAG: AAA family ATPase [Proteobacteria bacterium]|nr:AAA family ATPase [Pseudomonadota bacterium]